MDQESELNDLPEKKLATMRDVARAAGVSVSTVSRVLDERLPTSRSASAEKIRQVARELGYRRDYVASSLRRGDTGTLGVLVPRLTDAVTAMLFEAISRLLRPAVIARIRRKTPWNRCWIAAWMG